MNVSSACRALYDAGLCPGTSGNASQRFEKSMTIKPSGAKCSEVCELANVRLSDGRHDFNIRPSTDASAHRYIYNHCPDINGIVHTHSTYCTIFAVAQWPIPCCMTMMADEFGGDIPLSEYCAIGDEEIGKEVVRLWKSMRARAVLIRQHGLFTVGETLEAAVKSAIYAEECAKVAYHAMRITSVKTLPEDEIERNHRRYHTEYGQGQ